MSTEITLSYGEQWVSKTDPSKVLTIQWENTCGIVGFDAPWFKRKWGTLEKAAFLKRYKRLEPR